jgi:hypothetical protein
MQGRREELPQAKIAKIINLQNRYQRLTTNLRATSYELFPLITHHPSTHHPTTLFSLLSTLFFSHKKSTPK